MTLPLRRLAPALLLLGGRAFGEDDQAALEAWQHYQNACSQLLFDGSYAQATATCGAAVSVAERLAPGPQLEGSLNDLATALLHQQQYARAEDVLMRVLRIRVMSLGPDHLMVAGTLNLMAAMYRKVGRDQAAKNYAAEVARITGQCQGRIPEEQKAELAETQGADPCAPETVPPFLR